MREQEYRDIIRKINKQKDLLNFWDKIKSKNLNEWASGKAFEYLILRAFELEGAIVRYPYSVLLFGQIVEQIDGCIHLSNKHLHVLAEFKDQKDKVNIEPIAKLRNQLLRRPSTSIGCVFTTSGFTEPALVLSQFSFPQTILLWENDNIEYCLKNKRFIKGLEEKFKIAVQESFTNFDLTITR